MASLCGQFDCASCPAENCAGCSETGGKPFGGRCIAAEWILEGGQEAFARRRQAVMDEINALGIPGLRVESLNLLSGAYVNLAYPLPSGQAVRFLDDKAVYLGAQIEVDGMEKCYGAVADDRFLLVCRYGGGGSDPELVCYKKRDI